MFAILKAVFFAFGGLVVAALLSYQHYDLQSAERLCGPGGGCLKVLTSRYSQVMGVPIALAGAGFYAVTVGVLIACVGLADGPVRRRLLKWACRALALGAGASVALLVVQFGVIRAFCPLCTLSALFMFILLLSTWRARRHGQWTGERWEAALLAVSFLATLGLGGAVFLGGSPGRRYEVLARVDGRALTTIEMEREPQPLLRGLEMKLYETKRDWIERKIAEALIEAEARKRGIPADDLVAGEVDEKVEAPQKELEKLLENLKPAGEDDIGWHMTRRKAMEELRRQRRDAWIESLKSGHDIQVLLQRPRGRLLSYDRSLAHVAGPEDATVKLVFFSDFECPYCAELAGILQRILDRFPFEASLAYLHLPLGPPEKSFESAVAAECAAEQGKFWLYHDALMKQAGQLDGKWEEVGAKVGLNLERFRASMKSAAVRERVERSRREGKAQGLNAVPVLFINGRRVGGLISLDELTQLIQLELRETRDLRAAERRDR